MHQCLDVLISGSDRARAENSDDRVKGGCGGCLLHSFPCRARLSPLYSIPIFSPRLRNCPRPGHSAIRFTGEPLPIVHWNPSWLATESSVDSGPCESASAGFLAANGYLAAFQSTDSWDSARHSWQNPRSAWYSLHISTFVPRGEVVGK